MSEFPSSTGSGASGSWSVSHSGGPPTPAPSPNSQNLGHFRPMQAQGGQQPFQPFQCGICYDYLSSSVEDLDEHITKHKRELAERIEAQKGDGQEVTYHPQGHQQQMHFFASPSHTASPGQAYEYPSQVCSGSQQVAQFREFRSHPAEYRSADDYYGHHQGTSSSIANLYGSDTLCRQAGGTVSAGVQQEDYNQAPMKRARYENTNYERENLPSGRPDIAEENTADADPSADSLQGELAHGPVSFTDSQATDSVSYHEMQPVKSSNMSASLSEARGNCGTASGSFNSEQGDALNSQDSDNANSSRTPDASLLPDSPSAFSVPSRDDDKLVAASDSKDSLGDNFEVSLDSGPNNTSKDLDSSGDGNARSDNEASKSSKDGSNKDTGSDAVQDERAPRTRRSARMHYGRK